MIKALREDGWVGSPKRWWLLRVAMLVFIGLASLFAPIVEAQENSADVWYEVEGLNPGLDDALAARAQTPRDLIKQFLNLTENERFAEAAQHLNLNDLDEKQQAALGAELAHKLADVLQRRVVIDWSSLPERPDGMNVNLASSHPFAGKPRRTLSIAELAVRGRPRTISISRFKPEEGEAVWLFSPQTVANIPKLYELYGPAWLIRHIPEPLRGEAIGNVRVWELLVLPILLSLAVGCFLVMQRVIEAVARRTPINWVKRASHKVRTPLAMALTALLLQNLLETLLSFSGPITSFLTPTLLATIIFCLTLAVLRAIDATLELVTERYVGDLDSEGDSDRRHFYTNIYAARRYVLLVAVVVTLVLVLMQLNLFDSLGMSLLASAGVATVVLGIAGQTVLGNLLASLQIAIAKPIRIGDAIQYEGKWCYVEAIYYTFITLRAWDSRRLVVPVKYFISHPFENWTMTDAKTTRTFSLELDPAAKPSVLREVFEKIVKDEEHLLEDELLLVTVDEYSSVTQKIMFYATADSPTEAWMMNARLAERMGDWVRENHPEWWPRLRLNASEISAGCSGEAIRASAKPA
ncbi:mechanosensitive ion channel family protein [Roseibium sp.]|uniref:mechanosensitive ion channel family protein n=1 Tax=Roseibium sp. TaxID=1936156 RepID=UPI003A973A25